MYRKTNQTTIFQYVEKLGKNTKQILYRDSGEYRKRVKKEFSTNQAKWLNIPPDPNGTTEELIDFGKFRNSYRQQIVKLIKKRDGYTCQFKGCFDADQLEVHHIIPLIDGGGDHPANLITLCHKHHMAQCTHGGTRAHQRLRNNFLKHVVKCGTSMKKEDLIGSFLFLQGISLSTTYVCIQELKMAQLVVESNGHIISMELHLKEHKEDMERLKELVNPEPKEILTTKE